MYFVAKSFVIMFLQNELDLLFFSMWEKMKKYQGYLYALNV